MNNFPPKYNPSNGAPPVYRPSASPHAVQRQTAPPVYRPTAAPQSLQRQTAPPVYKPAASPHTVQRQIAPPVYSPRPSIQRQQAPPVYRPQTVAAQPGHSPAPVVHRPSATVAGSPSVNRIPTGNNAVFAPVPARAPLAMSRAASLQRMKRARPSYFYSSSSSDEESSSDDDSEYLTPQPAQKQERYNFLTATPESVIKSTAHSVVHFDDGRYQAVWTCRNCKRMLAYEDLHGEFHLTQHGYISKKGNKKKQRALELDHDPPWAQRLDKLNKSGASTDEKRRDYQDESRLRALCTECNGSHRLEGKNVKDYDSSDDDYDPPKTPPHHTQYNSGQWSGYRSSGFTA